MNKLSYLLGLGVLASSLTACGDDTNEPDDSTLSANETPNKASLAGKSDSASLCAKFNLPATCDPCESFGWYGDGTCDQGLVDDGACEGPDPDCDSDDPCARVVCNTPPERSCIGDRLAKTYATPGTCREGSCIYPLRDLNCGDTHQVCAAGLCEDPAATIEFPIEGGPSLSGTLQAGKKVAVEYAHDRLLAGHPECVHQNGSETSSSVVMGARFDDDSSKIETYRYVSAEASSSSASVPIKDVVHLPATVERLELWFYCEGQNGEIAWDRVSGQNYVFAVEP